MEAKLKHLLFYNFLFVSVIYTQPLDKMKISIFYDSHCDCSQTFLKKTFLPAYKNLQSFVTVDLVPYGRTQQFLRNGNVTFECNKPDYTCQANKIHACAVGSKSPENIIVEFVNCIIDSQYTKEDVASCCLLSGLQQNDLNECLSSGLSDKLLDNFGSKTRSYALDHFPAVVFDEKYDKHLDEKARENFMVAVCEYLNYEDSISCNLYDGDMFDTVKVSVFYESLCPDSIRFITQQLAPNYDRVADKIFVDFVPYGKATHNSVDGAWQFSCQHGANECYGNMMQACGLNETDDQATKVKFIDCVMSASYPAANASMEECANASGISWEKMLSCSKNGVGADILAGLGNRTHAVEPKITFVPTIVYNDVYDADPQASSLTDFLGTVCGLVGDNFCDV